jgi:hypothetical protein
MSVTTSPERLVLVDELAADSRVRRLLPRSGAVKRHLALRDTNGLSECGAVRIAANGRLLIDADKFVSCAIRGSSSAASIPSCSSDMLSLDAC